MSYSQMKENIKYQLFIGCSDSQFRDAVVKEHELEEMVAFFFKSRSIDFTLTNVQGGYQHKDGSFVTEDTLLITIIGRPNFDIIKLAKSLSMYMNQETALIVRHSLKIRYVGE